MLYSGILRETFHFLQISSTHNPKANINIIILLLAMATSRYPNSGQK